MLYVELKMTKPKIWLSSPHLSGREQVFVNEAFDNNWVAPLGPNVDGLERDHTAAGPPNGSSPAMWFYGRFINLQEGDRLHITISGPGGSLVDNLAEPLPRHKATYLGFAGVKRPAEMWMTGRYDGRVELVRDGAVVAASSASVDLTGEAKP